VIKALTLNEEGAVVGVEKNDSNNLTQRYKLEQNYPNPFNPETQIRFYLPAAGRVVMGIYNLLGQKILTLTDGRFESGSHSLVWNGNDRNGNDIASGIYFYQLKSGSFSQVKKMTLLR